MVYNFREAVKFLLDESSVSRTPSDYVDRMRTFCDSFLRNVRDFGMMNLSDAEDLIQGMLLKADDYLAKLGDDWRYTMEYTISEMEFALKEIQKSWGIADKSVGLCESIKNKILDFGETLSVDESSCRFNECRFRDVREAESSDLDGVGVCKHFLGILERVKVLVKDAYDRILVRGESLIADMKRVTESELVKGGDVKVVLRKVINEIDQISKNFLYIKESLSNTLEAFSGVLDELTWVVRNKR